MLAFSVPPQLAIPLQAYLRMFRPAGRTVTTRRLETLLNDLVPMIQAGKIERRGRLWPAPPELWNFALEEMARLRDGQKLRLPLANHNFLKEVICSQVQKAEAAAEATREQTRAHGHREQRWGASAIDEVLARQMPEHVKEQLERIGTTFKKDGDGKPG